MAFGKKRKPQSDEQEIRKNLIALLDTQYQRTMHGKPYWNRLTKLDQELSPRCIFVETFEGLPACDIASGEDRSDAFTLGEKTLVFKCKTKEGAIEGALILGNIFKGSTTRFIAEKVIGEHGDTFQIRSNIDKLHWEMLNLFCLYRAEKEKSPEQLAAYRIDAQDYLDTMIRGTENEGWRADPGVPAFVSAMGMHGVLRPEKTDDYVRGTKRRAQALEQQLHQLGKGTPDWLKGIAIHVNVVRTKDGYMVKHGKHILGYDPHKHAFDELSRGQSFTDFILQIFASGNPFEPDTPWTRRIVAGIGLGGLFYTAAHYGTDITYLLTPAAATAVSGVISVAKYVHDRLKLTDRVRVLKKKMAGTDKEVTVVHSQNTGREVTVGDGGLEAAIVELEQGAEVHSEVTQAAVYQMFHRMAHAPDPLPPSHVAAEEKRRAKHPDDPLVAKVYGATGGLSGR